MLRLAPLALLSGCWLAITDPSPAPPVHYSSGACIERVQSRRSHYYVYADEQIGDRKLERILERDPDERAKLPSVFRLRRAGWGLFGLGVILQVAAFATLFGAIVGDPKGEIHTWSGATILSLELSGPGLLVGGGVASGVSEDKIGQAVARLNARARATGVCPAAE